MPSKYYRKHAQKADSFQIEIYGRVFTSKTRIFNEYVWPIEEFIWREQIKGRLAYKLRKLNPHGKRESELPRGLPTGWRPRPYRELQP